MIVNLFNGGNNIIVKEAMMRKVIDYHVMLIEGKCVIVS